MVWFFVITDKSNEWTGMMKTTQEESKRGNQRRKPVSVVNPQLSNTPRDRGKSSNVDLASACDRAASGPLNDPGGFWNGNSCHKFAVWSYKGNLGMLNNPRTKHTWACEILPGFWRRLGEDGNSQYAHWRNKNFSQCSQAVGPCQKKL